MSDTTTNLGEVKITLDPRPGGVFETIMVNDETGEEYPSRAVYVEIVEPEAQAGFESSLDRFAGYLATLTA